MKKLIAALFAAALWAAPASATEYYVRANGNANNSGSYASSWTMAKANTTARPGDVIRVLPGSYSTAPAPDSAGSNPTGGGRITYLGTAFTGGSDPVSSTGARAQISVPGHTTNASYVTLAGLTIAGGFTWGASARWDSVRNCTISGNLQVDGDYCVLSESAVNGTAFQLGRGANRTVGNILQNSTFPNIGRGVTGNPLSLWVIGNSECTTPGTSFNPDSNRFSRLVVDIYTEPLLGDAHPVVMYKNRNFTQEYCKFRIDNQRTSRESYIYRLRDSTGVVSFNVDTCIVSGPGASTMFLSSNGNNDCTGRENSVADVTVDSCYWNFGDARGGSLISFQESMNNFTMTWSTVVANGPAIRAYHLRGKSTLDNNTFVGRGYSTTVPGGVLRFVKAQFPSFGDTALTFTENIVYSVGPAPINDPYKNYSGDPGSYGCAIYFDKALIDSAGVMDLQKKLISDKNQYFYAGYASTPGDRSIHCRLSGGSFNLYSSPGDSTATNPTGRWENRFNKADSLSHYGSPQFADSTLAGFNPLELFGSNTYNDAGSTALVAQGFFEIDPQVAFFTRGVPDSIVFTLTNHGDGDGQTYEPGVSVSSFSPYGIATDFVDGSLDTGENVTFYIRYDGTDASLSGQLPIIVTDRRKPLDADGNHVIVLPIVIH